MLSTASIAKRWNRSSSPTASASITPGRSSTISSRNIPTPQHKRAARLGIGALTFAFVDPAEAKQWVDDYYRIIKTECVPIGHAVNANIAMVTGFSVHPDAEEAKRRGEDGFKFFGYALAHHYIFGEHKPGRTDIWTAYERARAALPEAGAARGIGTPEQLRAHLKSFEDSGVAEVFLAACSQRTKRIRLGHGIVLMPPAYNHPARVAERIAALDLVSDGRVEFGTGESASILELGGFRLDVADKRAAWQESLEQCLNMMVMAPYPGFEGKYFSMPCRNVVPKPLQKPHPPVWVACSNRETIRSGRLYPARRQEPARPYLPVARTVRA